MEAPLIIGTISRRRRRRTLAFWLQVREYIVAKPHGAAQFARYQHVAQQVTAKLDALPREERARIVKDMDRILVEPAAIRFTPERGEAAALALEGVTRALAAHFGIAIPPLPIDATPAAYEFRRALFTTMTSLAPEARERLLTGAGA